MLNLGDDQVPEDEKFAPDGSYVPRYSLFSRMVMKCININIMHNDVFRIFFLDPDGNILPDIVNREGNPKFKYYYYSADSLLDSMTEVQELAQSWDTEAKDEL